MKGPLLSFFIFVLYVVGTALSSYFFKPTRHSSLFLSFLIPAIAGFFLAYYLMPSDLWFLGAAWQANYTWADVSIGIIILVLNIHSYIDWFFAFNGGFSTSLMLLLLKHQSQGTTSQKLINHYYSTDGIDKIHMWRLPRLEETGYLQIATSTKVCSLTKRGQLVAQLCSITKKLLGLGLGG